jgi:hypothetical protein
MPSALGIGMDVGGGSHLALMVHGAPEVMHLAVIFT